MIASAALFLALASAVSAAPIKDQAPDSDARKNVDLITDYGSNADLPPDRWACPRSAKPTAAQAPETPLQHASDLKCLTEWLWSVQRYFSAGGAVKNGVEPDFVAAERKRAAADAAWLSAWAAKISVPRPASAAPESAKPRAN
jgi:hypothetical protein